MKITATKTPVGLEPNPEHYEDFDSLTDGEEYIIEIKKQRNILFHRKYFALIDYAYKNQSKYFNKADFLVEIKLLSGHYEEHITLKGNIIYTPKSISFDKMDNIEFEKFYSKTIDIIISKFIDAPEDEIRERIERVLCFC